MADNIVILANEVSALMRLGTDYKSAIRRVLRSYKISNNWDIYFSEIGKQLKKTRRRKRKIVAKKKSVKKRTPAPTQLNLFANSCSEMINHLSL